MDIQDLLDEVEEVMQERPATAKKLATGSCDASSSHSTKNTNSSRSDLYRNKSVDDIDDLLSMIDGNDDGSYAAAVHPRNGMTTPAVSKGSTRAEEFHVTGGSKRCSALTLGGEYAKRGVNSAFVAHNVCANLRCNDCDFTVVQFLGKKWSSNADYMFFRENVPNESKLRARMEVAPGSAAYACQCKWLSIDVETRADMCRVKWSCAGH